jgi:hypothetical protein
MRAFLTGMIFILFLLPASAIVLLRPGIPKIVKFDLPAGDLATQLSRVPPRYWQLELRAERPGIDYDVKLLLPIY